MDTNSKPSLKIQFFDEPACLCSFPGCQGPSGFQVLGCILRKETDGHDEEGLR